MPTVRSISIPERGMTLADIADLAKARGLAWRGAFHATRDDRIPVDEAGTPARTIVLLGFAGQDGWPAFAASPEAKDGMPNPLDRWSRRVSDELAIQVGATALYPFDGPPWHPFQAWAQRGDMVTPSPIGLLIHPVFGLWHSYRSALAFAERLDLPAPSEISPPCLSCAEKPCLTACPVGAFQHGSYDVVACRGHLKTPAGTACMSGGCLARRACPVGREHTCGAEQTGFLMRAFRVAEPS